MSSNPSGVSLECTAPDSTHRKIVRELTRAKIAASSIFNISTCRKQAEHQPALLRFVTTTNRSVSTLISVRVFMVSPSLQTHSIQETGGHGVPPLQLNLS